MTSFGPHAAAIALAILLDTSALVVWDVGTRSPQRLVTDMRAGLGDRTSIVRGTARFLTGLAALVLAAAVLAPLGPHPKHVTILESGALVVALVLEALLGPALRAAALARHVRRHGSCAAGALLLAALASGCAHDRGDPGLRIGDVFYFARFTPPLTDHGALARLTAVAGDAARVRDTFVTEPESARPGTTFTVDAPRNSPRGFVPLLDDPPLRALRRRYEGRDVWTYGTGYVICEDTAPAVARHGPLRVRRIVHVSSAPATVGIGPAGYLNGENPVVSTDSPYVVYFDPPPGAPRICAYQWTFADPAELDTVYSLDSYERAAQRWSPATRAAVAQGRIVSGMTHMMVAWSAGFPGQLGTRTELLRASTWTYPRPAGDVSVTFRNDRVASVAP